MTEFGRADEEGGEPMRGLRWGAAALAAAVLLTVAPAVPANPSSVAQTPAGPVLTAVPVQGATAPAPDPATLAALLDTTFASPAVAASLGAVVFDPATGNVLYDRDGLTSRTPASTVKLLAALAVLYAIGPQAQLNTTAHYDAASSTLTLVGAGDPTLATSSGEGSSLSVLADVVLAAAAGPGAGTTIELRYDTSLFTGPTLAQGWSSQYPALGVTAPVSALTVDGAKSPGSVGYQSDPALAAAEVFAGLLRDRGLQVGAPQPGAVGTAPQIGETTSIPVALMVQNMLSESDNTMAEILGHLAGAAISGTGSFESAAAAVKTTLTGLDISTADISLFDSSGLSVDNRVSARTFTQVLSALARDGDLGWAWPIAGGMPVAGVTGTLSDRFLFAPANAGAGVVRAKTGTLAGVSSLAGSVVDRDGRLLVFAFLADSVTDIPSARSVLDQAAAVLATCGCRAESSAG